MKASGQKGAEAFDREEREGKTPLGNLSLETLLFLSHHA